MTLRYTLAAIAWLAAGILAIRLGRKEFPAPLATMAGLFWLILLIGGPLGLIVANLMCLPEKDARPVIAGPEPGLESF